MAGNNRFALYAGEIDTTDIAHISDASLEGANDVRVVASLGSVDPAASYRLGSEPTIRFTSHQVGTLIGVAGISGYVITTGLVVGWVERAAGGAFESTGHKVTAAKALVVPEVLTAQVGQYAEITYAGHCYSSDGTTQPVVKADTLPSATAADDEKYILGAVTIGGTTMVCNGISLAFGISVQRYRDPAHLYPTALSIVARNPVLELSLVDIGQIADANLVGQEVSTIVVNLLKLSSTAGGLAGSGNKVLTITKAALDWSRVQAGASGDAVATVTARARKDGATAIITVA